MAGTEPTDLPRSVRIAGRAYVPGADRGVAILYTAASWVIQRLPGQVLEEQRAELIRTLGQARNSAPRRTLGPPLAPTLAYGLPGGSYGRT